MWSEIYQEAYETYRFHDNDISLRFSSTLRRTSCWSSEAGSFFALVCVKSERIDEFEYEEGISVNDRVSGMSFTKVLPKLTHC